MSGAPTSDALLLATTDDAQLLSADGSQSLAKLPLPADAGSPTCAAVSSSGTYAAIGTEASKVYLFERETRELRHTIELRAPTTALAFPPEGQDGGKAEVIAIGLSTGKVPLYSTETGEIVNARSARPTSTRTS